MPHMLIMQNLESVQQADSDLNIFPPLLVSPFHSFNYLFAHFSSSFIAAVAVKPQCSNDAAYAYHAKSRLNCLLISVHQFMFCRICQLTHKSVNIQNFCSLRIFRSLTYRNSVKMSVNDYLGAIICVLVVLMHFLFSLFLTISKIGNKMPVQHQINIINVLELTLLLIHCCT